MLQEKKTKTNLGIGIGLLLSLLQVYFVRQHYLSTALGGAVLAWIAMGFLCWGCMNYAEGKGHSKWFGLLGLLSVIGYVILMFMPDRNKDAK